LKAELRRKERELAEAERAQTAFEEESALRRKVATMPEGPELTAAVAALVAQQALKDKAVLACGETGPSHWAKFGVAVTLSDDQLVKAECVFGELCGFDSAHGSVAGVVRWEEIEASQQPGGGLLLDGDRLYGDEIDLDDWMEFLVFGHRERCTELSCGGAGDHPGEQVAKGDTERGKEGEDEDPVAAAMAEHRKETIAMQGAKQGASETTTTGFRQPAGRDTADAWFASVLSAIRVWLTTQAAEAAAAEALDHQADVASMPDGPAKESAKRELARLRQHAKVLEANAENAQGAYLARKQAVEAREALEEHRHSMDAMPNGPEKEAERERLGKMEGRASALEGKASLVEEEAAANARKVAAAGQAEGIAAMSAEDRRKALKRLSPEEGGAAIMAMSAEDRAACVMAMSEKDRLAMLSAMSAGEREAFLASLHPSDRAKLEAEIDKKAGSQAQELAKMSAKERHRAMMAMSPADRAAALALLGPDARKAAYKKMTPEERDALRSHYPHKHKLTLHPADKAEEDYESCRDQIELIAGESEELAEDIEHVKAMIVRKVRGVLEDTEKLRIENARLCGLGLDKLVQAAEAQARAKGGKGRPHHDHFDLLGGSSGGRGDGAMRYQEKEFRKAADENLKLKRENAELRWMEAELVKQEAEAQLRRRTSEGGTAIQRALARALANPPLRGEKAPEGPLRKHRTGGKCYMDRLDREAGSHPRPTWHAIHLAIATSDLPATEEVGKRPFARQRRDRRYAMGSSATTGDPSMRPFLGAVRSRRKPALRATSPLRHENALDPHGGWSQEVPGGGTAASWRGIPRTSGTMSGAPDDSFTDWSATDRPEGSLSRSPSPSTTHSNRPGGAGREARDRVMDYEAHANLERAHGIRDALAHGEDYDPEQALAPTTKGGKAGKGGGVGRSESSSGQDLVSNKGSKRSGWID